MLAYQIDASGVWDGDRRAVAVAEHRLWSTEVGWRELPVVAGFPRLTTRSPLLGALYRLACQEALADVRPDGALMAGQAWPGVWTRDVAYSTQLALGLVMPDAAWASLKAKTFRSMAGAAAGRVRQDTGSGGAWPVSTDRVVWTTAAWALYLAHGDRARLAEAYELARGLAAEDWRVAHDAPTGLMFGESSFLDWREQTYPAWMEPADIYGGRALGTNVLHAAAYQDLARMARELGRPEVATWEARAAGIRRAIDRRLWGDGLYRAFLYPGPDDGASFQTEALGNALAVLHGVASPARAREVVSHYPWGGYGVPTIWPQLAHARQPYHNHAVWPFVAAHFALAGKQAGNGAVFQRGLADVMRAAALFGTHKENFVLETGRAEGTAVNSDRQLWSVAGFLALVYKGLFGLALGPDGYTFQPMVPAWLGPRLELSGLKVRGATLDVVVEGTGDRVRGLSLDGRPVQLLPYTLTGRHRVAVRLAGQLSGTVNERPASEALTAPDTPEPLSIERFRDALRFLWPAAGAPDLRFTLWRDGQPVFQGAERRFEEPAGPQPRSYTLTLRGPAGLESPHARARTTGAIWSAASPDPARPGLRVPFTLELPLGGRFRFHAIYANGAGPVDTGSRCALRSLYVDGRRVGALVLPQRGEGRWDAWGRSNELLVTLDPGPHRCSIQRDPLDLTMDEAVNEARLKALVVVQASREGP
jgi:hypothetical protein